MDAALTPRLHTALQSAPEPDMRLLVLLSALLMPVVAWFSERGALGPTNAAVSAEYPTLLIAAGYAFAIWGLIFLFDVVYGVWQATGERRWTASRHDLVFGSNAQLRSIVDVYAGSDGQERFVRDFVAVWDKLMMLDRFDVKGHKRYGPMAA